MRRPWPSALCCSLCPTSLIKSTVSVGTRTYYGVDVQTEPRLHDTTCCQTGVKPIWQPIVSCIQTLNRLSNPLDNRFDKRLYRVYSRLSNRLYNTVWQPVERTAVHWKRLSNRVFQTGLTNTVWQPVVWCIQTFNWLSNRFDNRFGNRLDVCLHHTAGCQAGCTTGLTTGCIV